MIAGQLVNSLKCKRIFISYLLAFIENNIVKLHSFENLYIRNQCLVSSQNYIKSQYQLKTTDAGNTISAPSDFLPVECSSPNKSNWIT